MSTHKNYYDILGIPKTATPEEIKKAYKKLVKEHHPDKGGDAEKFKEIAQSYEILSNPEKKAQFDNYGSVGNNQSFRDMHDMFNQAFGFGSRQRPTPRGEHIEYVLKLTLEEIQNGATKKIVYQKGYKCKPCDGNGSKEGKNIKPCGACHGTGVQNIHVRGFIIEQQCSHCGGNGKFIVSKCPDCKGNGLKYSDNTIEINVPCGVYGGWRTIIDGGGNESLENGGIPGKLVIDIEELSHRQFIRDGDDLIYRLNMPFPDLVLGKKVIVPKLNGEISFNVPTYTKVGEIFRLKELGMKSLARRSGTGDLLIIVGISIPSVINDEEKKILEELRQSCNFMTTENV